MFTKILLISVLILPLLSKASVEITLTRTDFHSPYPSSYKIVSDDQGTVEKVFKLNEKEEWSEAPHMKDVVQFISNEVINIEKVLTSKEWVKQEKSQSPQRLSLNVTSKNKKYEFSFDVSKKSLGHQDKRIEAWYTLIMEKEKRTQVFEYMKNKKN